MFCCLIGAFLIAHIVANWRKVFARIGWKHEDIDGEYDWKPGEIMSIKSDL
ncbi:MAG: hypothetical protein LBU19_10030 [Treponema sp.]|nr:hypothetical protein [Treponema sp.]